mmetsp:Transcript_34685/g.59609  ORF Transcript_34685/g.59609 Transcript_34685/m.59609 type:complete len:308 (+) Transcript_34685:113-1036(+)
MVAETGAVTPEDGAHEEHDLRTRLRVLEGELCRARSESREDCEYSCNVCLEVAVEPVVTQCGHLFCWPCLYRWLNDQRFVLIRNTTTTVTTDAAVAIIIIIIRGRSNSRNSHRNDTRVTLPLPRSIDAKLCPVCKAPVTLESVIPLYHQSNAVMDPRRRRSEIPQRPAAQRPEVTLDEGSATAAVWPVSSSSSSSSSGGAAAPRHRDLLSGDRTWSGGGGGRSGSGGPVAGGPSALPSELARQHGSAGAMSFRSEFAVFPSLFGLQFQSLGSSDDCLTSHETEEQSRFLRSVVTVLLVFLGAWIALI